MYIIDPVKKNESGHTSSLYLFFKNFSKITRNQTLTSNNIFKKKYLNFFFNRQDGECKNAAAVQL